MPKKPSPPLEAVFKHAIFGPDGSIEGALVEAAGRPLQLLVEHGDEAAGRLLAGLREGQSIVADAVEQGPSHKGPSAHAVHLLERLRSVDGAKPAKERPAPRSAAYNGRVTRFNYARHGAKNGVVLDTGDFIHLKPEGMAKAKLAVGDQVAADGDAWPLALGGGYVVEATVVNGKAVAGRPPAK